MPNESFTSAFIKMLTANTIALIIIFLSTVSIMICAKFLCKQSSVNNINKKIFNNYFENFKIIYYPLVILMLLFFESLFISYMQTIFTASILEISISVLCSIMAAIVFWVILGVGYDKFNIGIKVFKHFFNCSKTNNIQILFSNTIGYAKNGEKKYEIEDGLCSFAEICSINSINEILSKHPNKSFDIARGLIDSIWELSMPSIRTGIAEYSDNKAQCEIPKSILEHTDSIIIVGSTNKNFHRRYYYTKKKLIMKFPWEFSIHNQNEFCEEDKLNQNSIYNRVLVNNKLFSFIGEYNIAIIEKIHIEEGKTVFFCAGVRADDSLMAIEYLFKNWERLYTTFDSKSRYGFGVCIGMPFSNKLRKQFDNDKIVELVSYYIDDDRSIQFVTKKESHEIDKSQYSYIEKTLYIPRDNLFAISKSFKTAIELKANKQDSSLSLINSYFSKPSGKEKGEFITVDFGGTNIRANAVALFGDNTYKLLRTAALTMKGVGYDHSSSTSQDVFYEIASRIKDISNNEKHFYLGHTFSFPCEQTSQNNAILQKWTKEISISNTIGHDINKLLQEALTKSGVNNVQPIAILNDTVGVLLAKSYTDGNVSIGSICATGHNSAFFNEENLAISLESGNFDSQELRSVANEFDKLISENFISSGQVFEKMVSGAYLPHLFNAITSSCFKHAQLEKFSIKTAKDVAELALDTNPSNKIFSSISHHLLTRSARLIAASYHAIILYIDPNLFRDHTIGIDGSLFSQSSVFSSAMQKAINELFGNKCNKIRLTPCHGCSSIGAAVAAAMAVSHNDAA